MRPSAAAKVDYDATNHRIHIHRCTKTGNDEWLPVVAPLGKLLADGWEPISLWKAEHAILKRIEGTSLRWKGWYGFRRGLATSLYELGVPPEESALILRNSPEVVRDRYIRLKEQGVKVNAMTKVEAAFSECAATVP